MPIIGWQAARTDFADTDKEACIAYIATLKEGARRSLMRSLIFKKNLRPRSLSDQLFLLDEFSNDPVLSEFERAYALIASFHKALEIGQTNYLGQQMPRLRDLIAWCEGIDPSPRLRQDGTHLRFSVLNVFLASSILLVSRDDLDLGCDKALAHLKAINPGLCTHRVFNSLTNIIHVMAMAFAIRPAGAAQYLPLLENLMFAAVKLNYSRDILSIATKFHAASTLADTRRDPAFEEFQKAMPCYAHMREIARARDFRAVVGTRKALIWSGLAGAFERQPALFDRSIAALFR